MESEVAHRLLAVVVAAMTGVVPLVNLIGRTTQRRLLRPTLNEASVQRFPMADEEPHDHHPKPRRRHSTTAAVRKGNMMTVTQEREGWAGCACCQREGESSGSRSPRHFEITIYVTPDNFQLQQFQLQLIHGTQPDLEAHQVGIQGWLPRPKAITACRTRRE